MNWKKNFTGIVLFCAGFLIAYLLTRDAMRNGKYFFWSMRNDTGDSSLPETQQTKIIFENTLLNALRKTLSSMMEDKF